MISHLVGTVFGIQEQAIILNLGIVALEVFVPDVSRFCIGDTVTVRIYSVWNQEQGPCLYGFLHESERSLFKLLLDCSGIGPKLALKLIAELGIDRFVCAVQTGEATVLSSVSGVGPRKAEQLIFQLKNKLETLGLLVTESGDVPATTLQDISQALKALNYSRPEINRALAHIKTDALVQATAFDQLFRKALSFLTK